MISGGHHLIRIIANNPLPNERLLRLAGDNGSAVLSLGISRFRNVEPEVGFTRIGVETVARKAVIGEDRTDMGVEAKYFLRS